MPIRIDILRTLRGRWRFIALVVGIAAVTGVVASTLIQPFTPRTKYKSSAFLTLANQRVDRSRITTSVNLSSIVPLVNSTEVAKRAIASLKTSAPLDKLVQRVEGNADQKNGSMTITAQTDDRQRTIDVANAFALSLVSYLRDRNVSAYRSEVSEATKTLKTLQGQITDLNKRIGPQGPRSGAFGVDLRVTQRDAKVREYTQAYAEYQSLLSRGASPAEVTVSQPASVALPIKRESGLRTLTGPVRLAVPIGLGLIFAPLLALIAERLDPRVRSRAQAEASFGIPVLAELPLLPWRIYSHELVVASDSRSKIAATYRLLRAGVTRAAKIRLNGSADLVRHDANPSNGSSPSPPRSILVTSPGDAAGKSSLAGNLAAIFAEAGHRTVALSADFRRPHLHELVGVPDEPGFFQLMAEDQTEPHGAVTGGRFRGIVRDVVSLRLSRAIHPTSVKNLHAVPSGGVVSDPGTTLASRSAARVIGRLQREVAEVVVIDSSSLLDESESTPLINLVESVVIVARAGRTTVEAAQRTGEFLQRMAAPVAGVVILGPHKVRRSEPFRRWLRQRIAKLRDGKARPRLRRRPTVVNLPDHASPDALEQELDAPLSSSKTT